MIACASEESPRGGNATDDGRLTAFLLDVGDELQGRILIDRVEPRTNEIIITIRDRDTRGTQRLSIARDSDLSDVRKLVLNAATKMLLHGHAARKAASR